MDVVENVKRNVRYLRKRAGYTQEQMAQELDMSPAYLRRIEKGTANPSLAKLKEIAQFFMVNVPALILPPRINLPVRYVLHRQVRRFPGVGLYPTYGICVVTMPDTETEEVVDFIPDVTVEKAAAQRIVRECNEGKVAVCQVRDVIEDLLAQESFVNGGDWEPDAMGSAFSEMEGWDEED